MGAYDAARTDTALSPPVRTAHQNEAGSPAPNMETLWFYSWGGPAMHGDRHLTFGATIGVAQLRGDGFCSLRARRFPGTVVTRPFTWPGGRLLINAVGLGGGGGASLRTAVLREDLSEIDGLGAQDADPLSRDGVRQEQQWRGDGAGIERLGRQERAPALPAGEHRPVRVPRVRLTEKEARMTATPGTTVPFLDLGELEDRDNVELRPTPAVKHPANPVLQPGVADAWDCKRVGNWAGDIHWDAAESVFKCWYYGSDLAGSASIGYAVSADGVLWEKPRLGLHDYGGSTDNNICFRPVTGATSHFCLAVDDDAPTERRYQALAWSDAPGIDGKRNFPYYSADGIHWTLTPTPERACAIGDTADVIIDPVDPDPERRIKVYTQHGAWYGPDLEHLRQGPRAVIDPADGREQEIHFVYALPYRGAYVMLYDFDSVIPWPHHTEPIGTRKRRNLVAGAYAGDCRLAVSRDGLGPFRRIRPRSAGDPARRLGHVGRRAAGARWRQHHPVRRPDRAVLYRPRRTSGQASCPFPTSSARWGWRRCAATGSRICATATASRRRPRPPRLSRPAPSRRPCTSTSPICCRTGTGSRWRCWMPTRAVWCRGTAARTAVT